MMTAERKDQVASPELVATLMNKHLFTIRMKEEHTVSGHVVVSRWVEILQTLKDSRDMHMKVFLYNGTDWKQAKVALAEANSRLKAIQYSMYSVPEHAVILSKSQWP